MVRIRIRELIQFYDNDPDARRHSSAIKAVSGEELNLAILVRYFDELGADPKLLGVPCTTKKRRGRRLDGWLRLTRPEPIYYQVEAKSWSFHGAGGGPALSVDCSAEMAAAYRRSAWRRYWDSDANRFRNGNLNKVLTKMHCSVDGAKIAPLACVWAPLHPDGEAKSFFGVPATSEYFDRVFVFSASTFLRNHLTHSEYLDLPLNDTQTRLSYLSKLFYGPCDEA